MTDAYSATTAAVMIIRVWRERGDNGDSVRARMLSTTDVLSEGRAEDTAAGREEILRKVEAWLIEIQYGPDG